MYIATLSVDLLLGDVRSLKQKRSLVRPLVADLRRTFGVAVAEVGHLQLSRRCLVGMAAVGAEPAHCVEVLDACERFVAERPEFELLSARRRLVSEEDE